MISDSDTVGKSQNILENSQKGHGDQYVQVVVETPAKLNAEQRETLEKLAKLSGEQHNPITTGFFDKVKEMFGG